MPYTSHGHAYGTINVDEPRPKGVARCGGPGLCRQCAREAGRPLARDIPGLTRFRKKPVTVDAIRWTGDNAEQIKAFVGERANGECRFLLPGEITGEWEHPHVYEDNHGQWIAVLPGYWVIRGTRGEFYPCDPDAFAETYESAP